MSKREFTPEEITESLRACVKGNCCRECIQYDDALVHCGDALKRKAVDMIEAQAKRIEELEAELEKLREENRLIPVEERKPDEEYAAALAQGDEDVEVIAMIQGGDVATALRYDGDIGVFFAVDDGEFIAYTVTHWKPMPKGPEAE